MNISTCLPTLLRVAVMSLVTTAVTAQSSGNRAPVLIGTPQPQAVADVLYGFKPWSYDADGDVVQFSIVNKPAWASFSTVSGELTGIPSAGNAGAYSNIVISAHDGTVKTSLPAFSIQVTAAASNRAPILFGRPQTQAVVGLDFRFKPVTYDTDGDRLVFSILNRPAWASFNTATGELTGNPAAGDVGVYPNVIISVTDGVAARSLPAFSILVMHTVGSATVMWVAPTHNTDGSLLIDLAGYRVHYGVAGTLTNVVDVASANATSYEIVGLNAGTWHFAVAAYNTLGTEGDLSGIVSKAIP